MREQAFDPPIDRGRVRRKELSRSRSKAPASRSIGPPEALEISTAAPSNWCISPRRSIRSSSAQAARAVLRYGIGFEAYLPKRSGCSAISRCRFWSATTSSPPSTSRPIARAANCCCKMELGRRRAEERAQGLETPHRGRTAPFSSGFNWRSEKRAVLKACCCEGRLARRQGHLQRSAGGIGERRQHGSARPHGQSARRRSLFDRQPDRAAVASSMARTIARPIPVPPLSRRVVEEAVEDLRPVVSARRPRHCR